MRQKLLSFSPPLIGPEERKEVEDTLCSDWISTGPKTRLFEQRFAETVRAPTALALNSCTAALHLALAVLGVRRGDGVITTPMTFCSTVNVIEHLGGVPLLVDVEEGTLNLCPQAVATALDQGRSGPLDFSQACRRISALLPVHLYGHPCEMDALSELARRHDLAVVEDAAHAFPAVYGSRPIGAPLGGGVSSLACFSFYATKNLTTGEGGMLTGEEEWVEPARVLGLHGMDRDAWKRYSSSGSWYYEVSVPGYKYNLSDIQSAIGLRQLEKIDALQTRRRALFDRYNQAFAGLEELQLPTVKDGIEHARHLYVIRLNLAMLSIARDRFIQELRERNIGTSVHFIPIHLHPYYRDKYGFAPEDFPVAYREYQRIVSLPLNPRMLDSDVDDVVTAVREVVAQYRR